MMAFASLLSLFDEPTPDTSGYMIAGYIIIFAVMLGYVASLVIRQRNLEKDYETLQELEKMDLPEYSGGRLRTGKNGR